MYPRKLRHRACFQFQKKPLICMTLISIDNVDNNKSTLISYKITRQLYNSKWIWWIETALFVSKINVLQNKFYQLFKAWMRHKPGGKWIHESKHKTCKFFPLDWCRKYYRAKTFTVFKRHVEIPHWISQECVSICGLVIAL